MKNFKWFKYIGTVIITLFAIGVASAQSPYQLRAKCPNTSLYAVVKIEGSGAVTVTPCSGQATTFTGNVVIPSGLLTSLANGAVGSPSLYFTNSPTTGVYRPAAGQFGIATAGIANTVFSTSINTFLAAQHFFSNSAGTAQFDLYVKPSDTVGTFRAGDCISTITACIDLTQASSTSNVRGLTVGLGDVGVAGSGTTLNIVDATKTFSPVATGSTAIWDDSGVINHKLDRTITTAGTTGAQTIDKQAGTVNIAAAGTSIVITNSTVTTSSIVSAMLRTADTTCTFIKSVVPTANTITITVNAGCNAETSVGFIVWN